MNIEKEVRYLARTSYWQMFYRNAIDSGSSLFTNKSNLSGIQVYFLHWLSIYKMLYDELSKQEYSNLTEAAINDDDRCDAFLYWRGKKIDKQLKDIKTQERIQNSKLKVKDNATVIDFDYRG